MRLHRGDHDPLRQLEVARVEPALEHDRPLDQVDDLLELAAGILPRPGRVEAGHDRRAALGGLGHRPDGAQIVEVGGGGADARCGRPRSGGRRWCHRSRGRRGASARPRRRASRPATGSGARSGRPPSASTSRTGSPRPGRARCRARARRAASARPPTPPRRSRRGARARPGRGRACGRTRPGPGRARPRAGRAPRSAPPAARRGVRARATASRRGATWTRRSAAWMPARASSASSRPGSCACGLPAGGRGQLLAPDLDQQVRHRLPPPPGRCGRRPGRAGACAGCSRRGR